MKICDDEEIIEMNHPKEVHNLPFDAITDNGCSDSINVSAVLANMQNDTDSIFSMDGIEDSVTSLKENPS
ncbi:hypothetical protein Ahy_B05g075789 isoform B [Arachis hypogaea]|uniref:Uncharacterized protein n=1 Tax=Arachis hypogaea TaxID=3818 RepID=A0A444Z221_ARAHY|nr:hypothetical protein Ahy_B05g075789 isoform B [Arachis hypogaea]